MRTENAEIAGRGPGRRSPLRHSYQFSALGRRASSYGLCVRRSTTDPPAISRLGSASDRRDDPSPDPRPRSGAARRRRRRARWPRPAPAISNPQGERSGTAGMTDPPAGERAAGRRPADEPRGSPLPVAAPSGPGGGIERIRNGPRPV